MAKLACKACGGKVKMANGGTTPKKVLAKAQMGLNYGIPQTGTTNYSAPTMRKGGTHKMPNGKIMLNSKMKTGGTTTSKNGSAVEKIKTVFNAGSTTKKISPKSSTKKISPKLDPLRSGPKGIDPKRQVMREMGLEHVAEKVLETGDKVLHYFNPKHPARSFKQPKIKKKTLAERAASLPSSKKQQWISKNKQ
jgi:hypothetical protein